MASITIRELADDVLSRISEMATDNNRSIEDQAKQILERSVERSDRRTRRLSIVRSIAAMTPKGVPQTDSTALIREDRDR